MSDSAPGRDVGTGPQPAGHAATHEELEAELRSLRKELAALKARHAELLGTVAERDFEPPPHYR